MRGDAEPLLALEAQAADRDLLNAKPPDPAFLTSITWPYRKVRAQIRGGPGLWTDSI